MDAADHVARVISIGIFAVLAISVLRHSYRSRAAWALVLFLACVAAYLVLSSPRYSRGPGPIGLYVLAFATPAAFWSLMPPVFDDRPALTWLDGTIIVALIALGFFRLSWMPSAGALLYNAMSLALVAHALFRVIRGSPSDLVEPRRRFRRVFVFINGTAIGLVLCAEIWLRGQPASAAVEAAKSYAVLALTAVFATWLLQPNPDLLLPSAPASGARISDPGATAEDARLCKRLLAAMHEQKTYRQENLTIPSLARALDIPEYRLRRVINQQLGYRNFNAFLNDLRVNEARLLLADAANERLPILNLAMDLGYGSIGPFNRAFRRATGMTPTQYRRQHLLGKP